MGDKRRCLKGIREDDKEKKIETVFGKIIRGELPAKRIFENDRLLVIEDIQPLAPIHLLIIPKKEYRSFQEVPVSDYSLMLDVIQVSQMLAERFEIAENYRLVTNNGAKAGQSVFHLHFHLIGGKELGSFA